LQMFIKSDLRDKINPLKANGHESVRFLFAYEITNEIFAYQWKPNPLIGDFSY
jgi:hypothetical protein